MNKCILIGRFCKDHTITTSTKNDGSTMTIVRNSLALDRRGENAGADFVNVVAFGKTADFISKYFNKGSKIAVWGHINTGKYEKDGRTIYTTDVIIDECEFAESKGTGTAPAQTDENGFMNIPDNIEEELPFN